MNAKLPDIIEIKADEGKEIVIEHEVVVRNTGPGAVIVLVPGFGSVELKSNEQRVVRPVFVFRVETTEDLHAKVELIGRRH
jgi:hypothetical protein